MSTLRPGLAPGTSLLTATWGEKTLGEEGLVHLGEGGSHQPAAHPARVLLENLFLGELTPPLSAQLCLSPWPCESRNSARAVQAEGGQGVMEMNALPSEEGEVALAVPAAAAGVCAGQKLLLLPVPLGMSTLWFVRLFGEGRRNLGIGMISLYLFYRWGNRPREVKAISCSQR